MKRFGGLSDDDAASMAAKADLHKVNQVNTSTHHHQQGNYMKSYDLIIIASNVEKEVTMHENVHWSLEIQPTHATLKYQPALWMAHKFLHK